MYSVVWLAVGAMASISYDAFVRIHEATYAEESIALAWPELEHYQWMYVPISRFR